MVAVCDTQGTSQWNKASKNKGNLGIISNPSFGSTSPPPSLPLRYWEFIQFKNAVSSPSIKVKIFLKLGTFNRLKFGGKCATLSTRIKLKVRTYLKTDKMMKLMMMKISFSS